MDDFASPNSDEPVSTRVAEKVRRERVEYAVWIPEDASDDLKRAKSRNSQLRYLLGQITEAAQQYAVRNKLSRDRFETLLDDGIWAVEHVQSALVQYDPGGDPRSRWNFWKHDDDPYHRIQSNNVPYVDRMELEGAVGTYLNLSYRAEAFDKLLVDALVGAELYAFGSEMYSKSIFASFASPLQQRHALWAYIRGQLITALFFGCITALALFLYSSGVIGESATEWTIGICWSLFTLNLVVATAMLPFAWVQQFRARRLVKKLLAAMVRVYRQLGSNGPISVSRIRSEVDETASMGVVWPSPLFALLDDIAARTGRL